MRRRACHRPEGQGIARTCLEFEPVAALTCQRRSGLGELILAAMLAAMTVLPPARAEGAAQHLVAAVRAAVATPPSACADMWAMVGWGEPVLAPLWAAMTVQPLPINDELSISFCVRFPVLSSCCPWYHFWFSILMYELFSLLFSLFFCLVRGRASPTLTVLTLRNSSFHTSPPLGQTMEP